MYGGLRRTVAANVKRALDDAGLNKTRVSRETGIPRVTLVRCLDGHYPFSVDHLERIGALVGRDPESFMRVEESAA